MARDDVPSAFVRERRRIAVLAAVLLTLVSAYAALLSLSSPDASAIASTGGETLLLSGVLVAVSCAGMVATARPNECLGMVRLQRRTGATREPAESPDGAAAFPLLAHHCSCGRFADHTVRVAGRTVCAGCLGMAAGGAVGVTLALALGAGLLFLGGTLGFGATLLGAITAAFGLIGLYLPSSPGVHATANLAFVSGMVLVAVVLAGHGLGAGLLGILAALAVVGLRIEMSRWRHVSVYAECPWPGTCRGASAVAAARRATRR